MDSEEKSTELTANNNLLIRCYFCDEVFPNNEFQNHVTYCQSVIEKCPQNCGVYIERQQKDFHVTNYCSETIKKSTKSKQDNAVNNHKCLCCEYCCKTINEIESEVKILQLRIDDEKRNRLKFEYNWLNELSKFHQRYQETEEWRGSMFSVLSTLQKSIFREEQIRLKEVNDMKNKFDRIAAVLKNFEMSMNELDGVIKDIKNSCLSRNEEVVEHFDSWMTKQENRMVALHNLNTELEKLQVDHISRSKSMLNLLDLNEIIIENQEQCSEQVKNCGKDIEVFKEFLSQENFMISSIWYEQLEQFKLFKIQIEKADEKLEELLSWQKFVKKKLIKIENLWKLEPNESILNELQNSIMLYPSDIPVYSNGHLLWSVLDFEEQFEESQHTNITLRSPAFYTNEYGYKLQMRLYPNGLGQWKGRHMIISLHILNSDWDSLLEWPVKINATVSMKDQSTNNSQVKDVIKCFGNNLIYKENDSTKTLQMYVPHRLLKENKYINNNSIILEANVSVVKD